MKQNHPALAARLENDYEAGLGFKHKCGESAYPITVIDDQIVWECLIHGFVKAREVSR
jgi:hypothetical protein